MESKKNQFQYDENLSKTQHSIRSTFRNSQIDYDALLNSIKNDVDSVGRVKAERPPYEQNFLAPDQTAKPNNLKRMPLVTRDSSTPSITSQQRIESA